MSSRQAAAVALLAFVIWLLGILPTIYWADSGELTLGGFLLGLAHAPSFPVYALVVKGLSFLPLGDVAFRASLASVLFGALSAGALYGIFHRILARPAGATKGGDGRSTGAEGEMVRFPALGAGLAVFLFVVSPQTWTVAVRQEVYTLSLLMILALVAMLLQWARDRQPRWLLTAGFTFGLGLGNHSLLIVATFPALAVFLLWTDWRRALEPRTLAWTVAAFLLGLSAYLYLPLRSAADPFLDWNDPERWHGFVESFTKRSEAGLFIAGSGIDANLKTFAGALVQAFTPWLVGLAALGLLPLFRRDRRVAVLLLGLALVHVLTVVMAPTYRWDNPDSPGYLLLSFAVYALLVGEGLRRLVQGTAGRWSPPAGRRLASLVGGGAAAVAWWGAPERTPQPWDDRARAYGLMHLEAAPPGALLLTKSDPATFLPWYLQAVEGRRPDVRVVNRKGLGTLYYRAQLEQRSPGLLTGPALPLEVLAGGGPASLSLEQPSLVDASQGLEAEIRELLEIHLGHRPVLWEGGSDNRWVSALSRPRGPLFELERTPVTLGEADHRASLEFIRTFMNRMDPPGRWLDPRAGRAMEVTVFNLANALRREVPAPGERIAGVFGALWRARPQLVSAGAAYAFELFAAGRYREAEAVYRAVLEQAPGQPGLWASLGAAVARQGRRGEAGAIFREGLELAPGDPGLLRALERLEGGGEEGGGEPPRREGAEERTEEVPGRQD